MKMSILIKESVLTGHAIVAAAHASLKMYLEFERAKEAGDFVLMMVGKLEDREIALGFKPRAEWPRCSSSSSSMVDAISQGRLRGP